jgi:CRISPR-associated protein Cmr6
MRARRKALDEGSLRVNRSNTTHIGLWLDRYLAEQNEQGTKNEEGVGEKANHIQSVERTEVPRGYLHAFERWLRLLPTDHTAVITQARAEGRIALGLGAKGALENGLHLDHTWGVPVLPGSALKGIAAAAAHHLAQDDAWRKGPNAHSPKGAWHAELFGSALDTQGTEAIGRVRFLDAWWDPRGAEHVPVHLDIMTVHHADYYQGTAPPADTDSPNPVPFATISGTFLIALELTNPDDNPIWLDRAEELLRKGLSELGLGAKTNAGYGVMTVRRPEQTAAERKVHDLLLTMTPEERFAHDRADLIAASVETQIAWLLQDVRTLKTDLSGPTLRGCLIHHFATAIDALRALARGEPSASLAEAEARLREAQNRSINKKDDKAVRRKKGDVLAAQTHLDNLKRQAVNQQGDMDKAQAFLTWLVGDP